LEGFGTIAIADPLNALCPTLKPVQSPFDSHGTFAIWRSSRNLNNIVRCIINSIFNDFKKIIVPPLQGIQLLIMYSLLS
jgi:hypothetical protein